jgi:hypothetical protein
MHVSKLFGDNLRLPYGKRTNASHSAASWDRSLSSMIPTLFRSRPSIQSLRTIPILYSSTIE